MVNIVCFLWGDWCAPHGVDYVNKLYRGVIRHLDEEFIFICFFDGEQEGEFDEGIDVRDLSSPSWAGKLPKITAFNPAHKFEGQVLILDLDTVIVGNLKDIVNYRGDFCARAWYRGIQRGEWILDGDTISFRVGYGLDNIWEPFVEDPTGVERLTGGRERYWYRAQVVEPDMWQRLFPGQLLSYKNHLMREEALPDDAVLVSFHGKPRPHEVTKPWVQEYWV